MHGFLPVVHDQCTILILGSFPSVESLRKQEYYAHRQNSFWKIAFALFDEPFDSDYGRKKALLMRHNVALWDVLYSHEGRGSADKDILNPVPNDFPSFFRRYTRISHIFFNGSASEQFFFRLVGKEVVPCGVVFARLYSTSPANARYSFGEKLQNWSRIREVLQKT